jgi:hypothetical protein
MAGKIICVLVQPGEHVKVGATLLILEAMKMEQQITAPQDGVYLPPVPRRRPGTAGRIGGIGACCCGIVSVKTHIISDQEDSRCDPCISSYRLLSCMAWQWQDKSLAQEPPRSPLTPPSEETTANPRTPAPQFMQVEVDLGAGGPNIRVRTHSAWQARYRPSVRVGQARTAPEPEAETALPPQGGADELHQALEQALDRAKPPTPPSP